MMMMVLVSKQHKVTTKYKISPLCVSREKTLSYKNTWQVGSATGQVDFQVTCLDGRVAVKTIFEVCSFMQAIKI